MWLAWLAVKPAKLSFQLLDETENILGGTSERIHVRFPAVCVQHLAAAVEVVRGDLGPFQCLP